MVQRASGAGGTSPDRQGINRRDFLKYTGLGAGAVALAPILWAPTAMAKGTEGAEVKHATTLGETDVVSGFTGNPPFSFDYDGESSATLLKSWPHKVRTVSSTGGRSESEVIWSDPNSGLQVSASVVTYLTYGTTEWVVHFKNDGPSTSPPLQNVLGVDAIIHQSTTATYTLHHFNGSADAADDYAPQDTGLEAGVASLLFPMGGRPSNGTWPYFNVDWGTEGVMVAIGWPGQWTSQLLPDSSGALLLQAGMSSADPSETTYSDIQDAQLLDVALEPGEEVRTPIIVVMSWQDEDWMTAQNKWRRWMVEYNLPRFRGSLPTPIIPTTGNLSLFPDQSQELSAIEASVAEHTTLDAGGLYTHWWIDAGWYEIPDGSQNWSLGPGNWFPDPTRFPDGMKPTFELAAEHDMKSLLWSEPERVMPDTWLANNHPEWLIGQTDVAAADQTYLLDFGNQDAWSWAVGHFDWLISTQGGTSTGLNVFRQDFNMDPLDYWNSADTPGRIGMTQMKHVLGHLAFWEELRRRHPTMWIDSCASGGRRNDLETMRHAVPLLRSDYQFEPTGNQSQTYGISFWLPYYGTGVGPQDTNDGAWGSPQYIVRSSLAPCYASSVDIQTATPQQWADIRQMNVDFAKIKDDLLYSDFHPLTAFSLDTDVWMALQFNRPEVGSGAVLVFRRPQATASDHTLVLRGLTPERTYRVENLDVAGTQRVLGSTLMSQGLTVNLPDAPAAAILKYDAV